MIQKTAPARQGDSKRWLLEPMVELIGMLSEQRAWTWPHSGRVARHAVAFGKQLGLDRGTLLALHCAGLLHDIGKVSVPTHLLDKAARLTRDEWHAITKHSMASSLMLRAHKLPRAATTIVQSHHEWFNGTGYPLGLQGEAIPIGARVLSLADAYEAISSNRPYRAALPPNQVADEIEKAAGSQFDPVLVGKLLPTIKSEMRDVLPVHTLKVISDDPMVYRQLWFAAYPLGWNLQVWPPAWAEVCPPELASPTPSARLAVERTIIDGRSLRRAPQALRDNPPAGALWIDPIYEVPESVSRPLDLESLVDFLDFEYDESPAQNAATEPIKVLIADPYQLFRQALRYCLEERSDSDVEIVAEAKSPSEYRRAQATVDHQIAIIASDLLEGTHSASPLARGDSRITDEEAGSGERVRPMIVLVADEDLDGLTLPPARSQNHVQSRCVFIHRGAPAEVLLDAMRLLLKQT